MKTQVTYREIWSIAYPIILASLAQNIITVTDTAFLGRIGVVALGGSVIGGLFYFVATVMGFGLGTGARIVVARRLGENRIDEIGPTVERTFYSLMVTAALIYLCILFFSEWILSHIVQSPHILAAAETYIRSRSWGVFFTFGFFCLMAFYVGTKNTRVITYATFMMAGLNVILDYAMVFGKFGFPRWEVKGAAVASAVSEGAGLIFLLIYTAVQNHFRRFHFFSRRGFDFALLGRIVRISLPVMAQFFISIFGWFMLFIFIEKLGAIPLALSNIVRSVYILLLVPIWGLADTASTLVSHAIGAGRKEETMAILFKIGRLALVMVSLICVLVVIWNKPVLSVYTNNPDLIRDAYPVMLVVTVSAVILAFTTILYSGVTGTGNTSIALLIELICIAVYLGLAYFLIHVTRSTITTVWLVEWVYAIMIGIMSYAYLHWCPWQKKVV